MSVALIDSSANAVARTQTRTDGTFDLPAPSGGTYRWQFTALGLQAAVSTPLAIDVTVDDERDYAIALVPSESLLTLWQTTRSDTVPQPDPKARPKVPRFPKALLKRGITTAEAIVVVVVDERGRIDSTTAFRVYASAPEIFDNALAFAQNTRHFPARRDGLAVCRLIASPFAMARQAASVRLVP
jgi:hypothetical protein